MASAMSPERALSPTLGIKQLRGFLDKKGQGTIGSLAWKRRYFEVVDEDKINYYLCYDQVKEYKGCIFISDIIDVSPKENQLPEERWRFFIDTQLRRYDVKTTEEYMMWYWIEGIKNLIARIETRKVTEQMEQRRKSKLSESNLQNQLDIEKEKIRTLREEWKRDINHLKRNLFTVQKELKDKDGELESYKSRYNELHHMSLASSSEENRSSVGAPDETEARYYDIIASPRNNSGLSISFERFNEVQEDFKNVNSLLKEAESEIKQLNTIIREKEKILKELNKVMTSNEQEEERMKKRFTNEIISLRDEIDFLKDSKNTLEKNCLQREKEVNQLRHQLGEGQQLGVLPLVEDARKHSPPWVPDWFVSRCESCTIDFTWYRRKHHCRLCGYIFCYKCSNNSAVIPSFFYRGKRVRVCNMCALALKVSKYNAGVKMGEDNDHDVVYESNRYSSVSSKTLVNY